MDRTVKISTESTHVSRHELCSLWWLDSTYAEEMENDESMKCRGDRKGERKCGHTHNHFRAGLTQHQLRSTSIDYASRRSPSVSWQKYQAQWSPAHLFISMTQPSQEAVVVLHRLDRTVEAGPLIIQALDVSFVAQLVWIIVHLHLFASTTQNWTVVFVARRKMLKWHYKTSHKWSFSDFQKTVSCHF